MRAWLALGVALGGGACATYGQEVARIRGELLKLAARDLRGCLPVPSEVRPEGETEIAIYRWELSLREDQLSHSRFDEPPDTGDPDLTRERRRFLDEGVPPRHLAYCELSFSLRGGRVAALEVDGRDRSGLNAESDCIMELRDCVPESGKEP
jgi:hypothetical protein